MAPTSFAGVILWSRMITPIATDVSSRLQAAAAADDDDDDDGDDVDAALLLWQLPLATAQAICLTRLILQTTHWQTHRETHTYRQTARQTATLHCVGACECVCVFCGQSTCSSIACVISFCNLLQLGLLVAHKVTCITNSLPDHVVLRLVI